MTFLPALKSIFSRPKHLQTPYSGTHTSSTRSSTPTFRPIRPSSPKSTGILKLPPEILLTIFTFALTNNNGINKLHHPSSIGKTCRRFHEVLLSYIYGECKMLFQYSGWEDKPGCIYSRDKLELFRHYGSFVRKLSIISDHAILPDSTHLIARFPWAPSLPSALFDLTPSFTHLTSLEFDGNFYNSIQDLVQSLQYLLTTSFHLKKLSLNVSVRYQWSYNDVYEHLSKGIRLEQSNKDTKYAVLDELRIRVLDEGVDTPPGELRRYRLLEVLCLILKPATRKTKCLGFNIFNKWEPARYQNHREQIENERSKFFDFPHLKKLEISGAEGQLEMFDRFVKVNWSEVEQITALIDFTKEFDNFKFAHFIRRFDRLRTLTITTIQELLTYLPKLIPSLQSRPWFHISPWGYFRDSIILPRHPSLKVIKIGDTGDNKVEIEEELGWDVMRVCKLEMRDRGTRGVREVYEPYRVLKEGKWQSCGEISGSIRIALIWSLNYNVDSGGRFKFERLSDGRLPNPQLITNLQSSWTPRFAEISKSKPRASDIRFATGN
ncbi:hypothetical protein TWF192_003026 [Orbilia oligospora]|uniref:F-box domain-containing protein n=1 Tax=Orbilia oligospora TaxID=2813651 RepID=A0A6G1MDV2_ORBOL|nr:hypothetical protein TWF679_008599 [Orbilia oligospora]KAF3218550.1 hypothetical protein TWF191_008220 [Orbilia oligospora]KAF3254945.1 hypothetical protein TWF192_003026 [Orbilia oligospora]